MKEHKTQNLHFHGEKKVFSEHAIASEYVSMTQLLSHTFTHLTEPSFRLKAKLLPNKKFLGLM